MTQIVLRFLNFPALILMTLVGVAVQSSLFTFWLLPYIQPDLPLLLTIWCALKRRLFEGGILVLIIARIAELHSASVNGLYFIIYMAVYLAVRLADRVLVIPDFRSYSFVTLFASVLSKLTAMGLIHLLGVSANQWKHVFLFVFPSAIMNAVLGFWLYRWLARFDLATFKNARADRLNDDEVEFESVPEPWKGTP